MSIVRCSYAAIVSLQRAQSWYDTNGSFHCQVEGSSTFHYAQDVHSQQVVASWTKKIIK